MKLHSLRLSNFQSFGENATEITFNDVTFLIGSNGSGKTAALQALCRLFSFDQSLRRIQRSDFHIPVNEAEAPNERTLWIEADFQFSELLEDAGSDAVPPHFSHMRLDESETIPRVRYRLSATMNPDGDIEENFAYVLDIDEAGLPLTTAKVPQADRNKIHVYYLPARRDPADHVAYGANALLGRMLRAANWGEQKDAIKDLTEQINDSLNSNPAIHALSENLNQSWEVLHKGNFFSDPSVTFAGSEIESFLRHMSLSFSPGHIDDQVDFSRLSDGQKSMLYLSLVLSSQSIGRSVLAGEDTSFDPTKLRPPVFTIVAVEEPENSLSPHYLGRIISALNTMASNQDAQAVIATHSPSMLRRIHPEHIRYLQLSEARQSKVTCIQLPDSADDAHKFVREAVQAFPEIYFSRFVILGEGDSEEIVLPRLLLAKGVSLDQSAVTIAPLGGRHVNHFWRLLSALHIPHLTLLDLDVARYQGGWGRIKYVNDQLGKFRPTEKLPKEYSIQSWNSADHRIREYSNYCQELENRGIYFSCPMDLDFAMMRAYPEAYGVKKEVPDETTIKAVLGKKHHDSSQYTKDELDLFDSYHHLFKLNSKPASHIEALMKLSDGELLKSMPKSLGRLADAVKKMLAGLPE